MTETVEQTDIENQLDIIANEAADLEITPEQAAEQSALAEAKEAEAQSAELAAEASAQMAVGLIEAGLSVLWPYVQVEDKTRAQAVEKLRPVMAKYGDGLPTWLAPYKEELEAGLFLASAGVGIFMQIQAHKKAEAQAKAEAAQKEAGEGVNPHGQES